eukprot:gene1757-2097_t
MTPAAGLNVTEAGRANTEDPELVPVALQVVVVATGRNFRLVVPTHNCQWGPAAVTVGWVRHAVAEALLLGGSAAAASQLRLEYGGKELALSADPLPFVWLPKVNRVHVIARADGG